MSIPESLLGDSWTVATARHALPIVVAAARLGRTITYGEIDQEIVNRKLGHHVLPVQYGHPAGTIGNALLELSEQWETNIPPLNAIIVNAKDRMPGDGVDQYLKTYFNVKKGGGSYSQKQRRAIVEEIQADVFAYKHWARVVEACGLKSSAGAATKPTAKNVQPPVKGGWSSEPESEAHRKLKEFVAANPKLIGLPSSATPGRIEYLFASADRADVVFIHGATAIGVEVKSEISNVADLTRGLFQAVKYQALLRAEQRARLSAPTATAVLVIEERLPEKLRNLAKVLGIEVIVVARK